MTRKKLTLEQKIEKVKDLRPIDDVFFEVLADDTAFCQEMLRIILEDAELVVADVIVQSSIQNIYGRSVRLDALCTLGNGKKCNVEVQRSDHDSHVRRVRFNAASILVKDSQTNTKFWETENIIVVYISQFDIFRAGKVLYHVDSVIRETGQIVDDGLERVFVNTEIHDGSICSEYLKCFLKKEVENPQFPELTRRMNILKHEEGGLDAMCEVMERYEQKARSEGRAEGRIQGELEKGIRVYQNLRKRGFSKEEALSLADIPESAVEEAGVTVHPQA